jgi:site-specific recombinase XerD
VPDQGNRRLLRIGSEVSGQEFARHADISSTQIYARVTRQRLLRAINTLNYLEQP